MSEDLGERLETTLRGIAAQLRDVGIPDEAARMEQLANQVPEPCVVAVVGRINSGKSTFINALLEADLAKVGPTETTATLNYFRYGVPNADRPVRCHWRGNKITIESRQFLDDLQNASIEALQRSSTIDYLEYRLQNAILTEITLVDTPGTGSVETGRQERTEAFLNLYRQQKEVQQADSEEKALKLYSDLEAQHQQETVRTGSKADAVIYLIGEIARSTDQAFLEEFQHVTSGKSSSLNAIGVMAKIDLSEELIKRREALAKKIAHQLQKELNTVIPVSAGLYQALSHYDLNKIVFGLRDIPPTTLKVLLVSPEAYLEIDGPPTPDEWKELRGDMPWTVFTTIARTVMNNPSMNAKAIGEHLTEISGFAHIRKVLEQHFSRRGSFLRCYRIVNDALKIRDHVRSTYLTRFSNRDEENRVKLARFQSYISRRQDHSPPEKELKQFINDHLAPRSELLEKVIKQMEVINSLGFELIDDNNDFEALLLLENHPDLFQPAELEELQALFGLRGAEINKRLPPDLLTLTCIEQRQGYWSNKKLAAEETVQKVAVHAVRRYGLIAREFEQKE